MCIVRKIGDVLARSDLNLANKKNQDFMFVNVAAYPHMRIAVRLPDIKAADGIVIYKTSLMLDSTRWSLLIDLGEKFYTLHHTEALGLFLLSCNKVKYTRESNGSIAEFDKRFSPEYFERVENTDDRVVFIKTDGLNLDDTCKVVMTVLHQLKADRMEAIPVPDYIRTHSPPLVPPADFNSETLQALKKDRERSKWLRIDRIDCRSLQEYVDRFHATFPDFEKKHPGLVTTELLTEITHLFFNRGLRREQSTSVREVGTGVAMIFMMEALNVVIKEGIDVIPYLSINEAEELARKRFPFCNLQDLSRVPVEEFIAHAMNYGCYGDDENHSHLFFFMDVFKGKLTGLMVDTFAYHAHYMSPVYPFTPLNVEQTQEGVA